MASMAEKDEKSSRITVVSNPDVLGHMKRTEKILKR